MRGYSHHNRDHFCKARLKYVGKNMIIFIMGEFAAHLLTSALCDIFDIALYIYIFLAVAHLEHNNRRKVSNAMRIIWYKKYNFGIMIRHQILQFYLELETNYAIHSW